MLFLFLLIGLLILLVIAAYFTNPFNQFTLIRRSYIAKINHLTIEAINRNHRLVVRQAPWYIGFAVIKNGIHILSSRWIKSPKTDATTVEDIIKDIRCYRFNPDKLLLTTGDHFSALFVRNLGVFYYPVLDQYISDSEKEWQNRQIIYLQTVAYALGVFGKYHTLTTTIVPTGPYSATCVNFYAYPSDTLYGILFALAALLDKETAQPEEYAKKSRNLYTVQATEQLLAEYAPTLRIHYENYRKKVFDEKQGLIRKDIHLSGAKDITRRTSAFFDNVIFWKTTQLASKLGLLKEDKLFLQKLKERILKTYWLEKEGYFLEDMSDEGRSKKYYSSDWLIVLATGFLRPSKKSEKRYFEQSINYIQKNNIDQPFAIKYQHETRAHRQFLAVRIAVASYGGDSIWSFWGMEYIKSLLLLYKHTGKKTYLQAADYHIKKYKENMLRDGGFPEVYDSKGELLETPFYRSVRQAGWVIGFEQVLAMRQAL